MKNGRIVSPTEWQMTSVFTRQCSGMPSPARGVRSQGEIRTVCELAAQRLVMKLWYWRHGFA
jgi:hypothetical protein